jgi:hypothetical protein
VELEIWASQSRGLFLVFGGREGGASAELVGFGIWVVADWTGFSSSIDALRVFGAFLAPSVNETQRSPRFALTVP